MCRKTFALSGAKREEGFAMVMALAAMLMLAVLGAASLLLMVSTLTNAENNRPENRAFQIAKAGLSVAHTRIVGHEVPPEGYVTSGEIMGGKYAVEIVSLGGYDYKIISSGEYVDKGTIYRRTIQETAAYSAERSFDVLRNYILYAGRNLTIDVNQDIPNGIPITFNGNIRAEKNLTISCTPNVRMEDGLTVNGNVEAKESLSVSAIPGGTGNKVVKVNLFGNIKSGYLRDATDTGKVTLTTGGGGGKSQGIINAAAGGSKVWDLYASSLVTQKSGSSDVINTGNVINHDGVDKVHAPQPDFDYYKILAMDQGNFFPGDKTISGDLGPMGVSSVTVVYCTGNLTLQSVNWNEPDMKGIFVCEGNFTTDTNSSLKFERGSLELAGENWTGA